MLIGRARQSEFSMAVDLMEPERPAREVPAALYPDDVPVRAKLLHFMDYLRGT
jgi:hypothetical protein